MDLFELIVGIIISLIFITTGLIKLIKSYESGHENLQWAPDISTRVVRFIAIGEIIGAFLFMLPYYLNFLPFISTISAFLLVALMVGAPISHLKLGEHKEAAITTSLLILILLVTFLRIFG